MPNRYNQWVAMWAVCRAACRAIFKSPQAIFFSLFFPIVLIMVFGALTGSRGIRLEIAFAADSDTANVLYYALRNVPGIDVESGSEAELTDRLMKGRITAIVTIVPGSDSAAGSPYTVHLKTAAAGRQNVPVLESLIREVIHSTDRALNPRNADLATITKEEVKGRPYRMIDFYLPGMLGFSLIGSAVFGVAFLFFSLRETLVLKRMFATPVKKGYIVLGESIARVLFQLTTAVVLILFGKYFYHFTLANGWATFFELLVLSFFGLVVFIGFGFIISSVSKNQNVIPIYANLFLFPQYFLSGTFFPKTALPAGIQSVINYLPLTALNDAMRKVSFEGLHLSGVISELGILAAWCVVTYAILIRVFKWE
jgi:ABC-2 type transport system permease protein